MVITTQTQGHRLIAHLAGRLDAITCKEFDATMATLLQAPPKVLILEFNGVEYMSSAGLRSLLAVAKSQNASGGVTRFCGLTGMVREVFTVTGFASLFPVYSSLDEALDA